MNTPTQLPRHIAIIMDGNGRWAKCHGEPRLFGHKEGANSVREVVRTAREIGIEALTLFAFSEQNWERPPEEVNSLMLLLRSYLLDEREEIMQNNIRFLTIGSIERLPLLVREPLISMMEDSKEHRGMSLCLALSYGGREDIVQAVRRLAQDVQNGKIDPDEINELTLEARMFTNELPPLDLLIRTSGEYRLSNFLLWQAAYAELYFTPVFWPEFRREHLLDAILEFGKRERRFGRTACAL